LWSVYPQGACLMSVSRSARSHRPAIRLIAPAEFTVFPVICHTESDVVHVQTASGKVIDCPLVRVDQATLNSKAVELQATLSAMASACCCRSFRNWTTSCLKVCKLCSDIGFLLMVW
jgi:hypothetical protein